MDFSKLKKLESTQLLSVDENQVVTAIIKVKKADYFPKKIEVRSKIDSYMFTCKIKLSDLKELESDPLVETISINSFLPLQKLPK